MISWSFIKNQVSLIHWDYKKFLDEKVDTLENAGTLASTLTTANHEELKDMFAFEYTGPVVELGVMKSLHKSDSKFAIIQTPGSVIAREFTIRAMNYMEKNPNCSVLCHYVHKSDDTGDRWWGIMPYVLVVNLEHFQKAGRLFFGNRRDTAESDQVFPKVTNIDGILKSAGEITRQPDSKLFYGWNWISKFLLQGYEVHMFDERINPFRQFVYYESDEDMKNHNWLIENMNDYIEDGEVEF